MNYPDQGKSIGNDDPLIIPVTYATATSVDDDQQAEAHAISPEVIQVVTIDESHNLIQEIPSTHPTVHEISSSAQHQQQGQEPSPPLPSADIDPATIHVVTFDEQPSEVAAGAFHQAPSTTSSRRETTPLLHQSSLRSENDEVTTNYSNFGQGSTGDGLLGDDWARCYDLPWAILFWGHIAAVVYAGTQLAPQGYAMMQSDDFDLDKLHDFMQRNFVNDDDFTETDLDMLIDFLHQFQGWWAVYPPRILWFAILICVVSFCMNMMKNHFCIQTKALIFVATSVFIPGILFGVFLILNLSNLGLVGFLFCLLVAAALAIFVRKELWPKLNFAALNLEVALTGMRGNLGTYLWVQGCAEVTVLWIIFWVYTFFGMIPYVTGTRCPEIAKNFDPNNNETCPATARTLLGLLFSLYWTLAYIGNTVQVYVAGVMATWCFDKDAAQGFCSSAVTSSMYRSLTFSSGPIAFGSLVQGAAKVLRSILSHSNRNQHRSNQMVYDAGDDCRCCCFGLCGLILECLSEVFGEVLDYFNQWAYCFVGINGTSYLESGKAAMNLFKTRGWTALITDRLVALVLGVGILESGLGTGLVTILMERLVTWIAYQDDQSDLPSSYVFGPVTGTGWVSFIFGFIIGCVMSGVMMNVIHGAVNTLIVCWAESPESFKENHKYWADRMTEVWSSAFPGTQFQEVHNSGSADLGRYGATSVVTVT